MIKLFKYAKLLVESNLTPSAFGTKLKAAIETIFDADNVVLKKAEILKPTNFANSVFTASLTFKYRNVPLKMDVVFYHLKFAKHEIENLNTKEFMDMVKTSEAIPRIDTPEDILRSPNIQVMLTAHLSYHPDTYDTELSGIDDIDGGNSLSIGLVKSNNIRDLMLKAKKLIDDLGNGGGDDGGPDEPEPVAPTPSGKLVTV